LPYQWLDQNLQQDDAANPLSDAFNRLRGKDPASGNIQNASSIIGAKKLDLFGSSGLTPAEQRAKEMEDALGWLRSNDLNYDSIDIDEQTDATVQKIMSMVPVALGRNRIEVAATMEGELEWLRSNGTSKSFRFDDPSQVLTRRTAAIGAGLRSAALAQALTWLKQNDTSRMYQ
jgi:hypothetical protein